MSVGQLTVLGAGLIGGSVCLGVRAAGLAQRIIAIDRLPRPERSDVADMWVDAADQATMTDVLGQSDITVLCMPVKTNIQLLPLILDRASGWVTDCGSTKASTSRAVATHSGKARFIPGHPMAGNPVGGLDQARPDLFRDRKWILCPEGADPGGVDTMLQLISGLGASPLLLDAEQHDHSVAWTSHLPQVVASALSVLATEEQARGAAGPGFASATRVAGGEENMWRDIFETNGREIALALQQLGARLSDLGHTLGDGNTDEILQILKEARRLREP